MFTGIIREVGVLKSLRRGSVCRTEIEAPKTAPGVDIGDSVAVNGVCLTVTGKEGSLLRFDAVPETLSRSTLGGLKTGDRVNIEPALRVGEMLGGHIVQGHVDGVGRVSKITDLGESVVIDIDAPAELMNQIVEKGSVALDGVSLTVSRCGHRDFSVAVIPHTLAETTLKDRKPGSAINIETDIIGKYLEKLVRGEKPGLTADFLAENGFM